MRLARAEIESPQAEALLQRGERPLPAASAAAGRPDVNALARHAIFDLDARLEMYGRTLLAAIPAG